MTQIFLRIRLVFPAVAILACTKPSPASRGPENPADAPAAPVVDSIVRPTAPPAGISAVPSNQRELVRPAALPAEVRSTCDSVSALVKEALGLEVVRQDGQYFDSFRSKPRLGCRLRAEGSFATLQDSAGPVTALEKVLKRRGWKTDLRYMADGPDGSDIGLRRLDQFCLVLGQWDGGDDSDTTPAPATEAENRFETTVECSRDVASNQDAGVPDSIWRIASAAGLDSVYAIAVWLESPPYLDGDFDGDGVRDGAVLVENRATGKSGVAMVYRGTRRVTILAAGSGSAGPDDLSWMDRWDVFHAGTTYDLGINDRPTIQLGADALWIGRQDSLSAFYIWTGRNYVWDAHSPPPGTPRNAITGQVLRSR